MQKCRVPAFSFWEDDRLRYEEKDFEQLKKKTGEFLENGALGNIRPYWEMRWPYSQKPENYLNGLAKADVRKGLISFLYNMSHGRGMEKTRAAEQIIGELWEYGRPDKAQDRDMLQSLVWDTCMLLKNTCYWDWEEMWEIGESDTDIVRKMYGKLRTLEGREQQSDIFAGYLETYDLPVKTQAEMEQLETRLLNYPSPDREEDRSIKNSYQLRDCVQWIQELSAAWFTLPSKAYRNLNRTGVWRDYVVPQIPRYQTMSCYEVVSDIISHVKGLGDVYGELMKTMGREHIEPQEIPSRYDWQYLRDAEPACIEALATQKGLYFGEALGTFYESRFAMMLEQGRERYAWTRAEAFAEYLEHSEPELFMEYECGCQTKIQNPGKRETDNRRSVR